MNITYEYHLPCLTELQGKCGPLQSLSGPLFLDPLSPLLQVDSKHLLTSVDFPNNISCEVPTKIMPTCARMQTHTHTHASLLFSQVLAAFQSVHIS